MTSLLLFSKMHGAGNDFIISDDKNHVCTKTTEFISGICDRQRGVGADGLIIISTPENQGNPEISSPFYKMEYFNCDGASADMCGNGLRCAALYAHRYLTANSDIITFETGAGILETRILNENKVQIQMPLLKAPEKIEIEGKRCFSANTGVPHLIIPVEDTSQIDVAQEGNYFRNLDIFKPEGTNVNFITIPDDMSRPVRIRTYERGIEGETSACGTGITASAISLARYCHYSPSVDFITKDNDIITIDFSYNENIVECFKDILLTGPAEEVFRGEYL